MPRHKPIGPATLTITEDAMRLALVGLEKVEAEVQSHIADVRASLEAPVKRTYKRLNDNGDSGRGLSEAQLISMRQNAATARAKRWEKLQGSKSVSAPNSKSVVVPPKPSTTASTTAVQMEFWPNGEPKYVTNPDGSVKLTRFGRPWKRIRQGQATAAAIKSHVARGFKPASALKQASRMAKQAGVAKPHQPVDSRHHKEIIQ